MFTTYHMPHKPIITDTIFRSYFLVYCHMQSLIEVPLQVRLQHFGILRFSPFNRSKSRLLLHQI